MNITISRSLFPAAVLLGLLFVLSACAGRDSESQWLDAPDWSRARLITTTAVADPVTIVLDETGKLYLLVIESIADEARPRIIAVDRDLNRIWDLTLPDSLTLPDLPRLILHDNLLRLFWISDESLFTATVTAGGELSGNSRMVSGDRRVASYDVATSTDGGIVLWFGGPRRAPGLYAIADGLLASAPVPVDARGVQPTLRFSQDGGLHALWAHNPPGFEQKAFFYADYEAGEYIPDRQTRLAAFSAGTSRTLDGPFLALDTDTAYVIWTLETRSGPSAGAVSTEFIEFPIGQPELASGTQSIVTPRTYELTYVPTGSGLLMSGSRVDLGQPFPGTSSVRDVYVNPSPAVEVALIFNTQIDYLYSKTEGQVSLIFLDDGAVTSYQLLTFTPSNSRTPAIAIDGQNQLYATWLERAADGGFAVYIASTSQDMRAALNTLTTSDYAELGVATGFGLMAGAVLSPFLIGVWLIVPLVMVGVTLLLRRNEGEGFGDFVGYIAIALGVISFWFGKLVTLPGIRDYTPFTAWIPRVPDWLDLPLRAGVPLLITLIGLVVAWLYTYRRGNTSPIYFILIYAGVDGALSAAVYGVLIYGAI